MSLFTGLWVRCVAFNPSPPAYLGPRPSRLESLRKNQETMRAHPALPYQFSRVLLRSAFIPKNIDCLGNNLNLVERDSRIILKTAPLLHILLFLLLCSSPLFAFLALTLGWLSKRASNREWELVSSQSFTLPTSPRFLSPDSNIVSEAVLRGSAGVPFILRLSFSLSVPRVWGRARD